MNKEENLESRQTLGAPQGGIPETLVNNAYTPGFLRKYLGSLVKAEFLIGTTNLETRTGILEEVGVSYIVLSDLQDRNITYCDIYSIKFVTIATGPLMYNPTFQI